MSSDRSGFASQRAGSADYGAASASYSSWEQDDQLVLGYQQAAYEAGPGWADSEPAGVGYGWGADAGQDASGWPLGPWRGQAATRNGRNAIRGFPPLPDEPLPVYPPGPFAAWNKSAAQPAGRAGSARDEARRRQRSLTTATITPDEFDTDYSLPAIKDPAPGQAAPGQAAAGQAAASARAGRRAGGHAGARASTAKRAGKQPASGKAARDRGQGGPSRDRAGRGRSRHLPVWLAIGTAAVIVAAVVVVLVTTSIGRVPASVAGPTASPSAASPTPKPPPGKWEYIGRRKTDPIPLTLGELFPATFASGGAYYHLMTTSQTHSCHTALIGGALQAAIRHANCTQALRATYVSRIEKAMATVGVFNLASSTLAGQAALHAGRSQFVAQLAAKSGTASKIGQGTGIEEALVKGHYLVLAWAENVDLATPKTKWQRHHLTKFMNTLISETVNGSLSYRMVEGKPSAQAP